ncbi:hypothetical protein ACFFKU_03710 [Kineococcus gynurae]|uniref:DUF222 domain-containing protein n=1 Tax=Kineococcus gynurae TaxID=452979 RepID=A0ABV5LRY3_9ACTN
MSRDRTVATGHHDLLAVYLNDHLAGATAGLARFRRTTRALRGTPTAAVLATMSREVADDRASLRSLLADLQVRPRHRLLLAARVGEALGALKPNGRLVRPSPLRPLVELEGLLLGVRGKAAGWRTLRELAAAEPRLPVERLDGLIARADRQAETLEELHREAAREVFTGARP